MNNIYHENIMIILKRVGEDMNQELIIEERNTLIGRLFTLGGSILFLIGSFIAVIAAYQAYNRVLTQDS